MAIIPILLALVALYCGGMWLFVFAQSLRGGLHISPEMAEEHSFHLGLCFILAIGFLGLLG